MKNITIGLALMLISSILYGSNLIAAAIYSETVANTSWNTNAGIFGTALAQVSWVPMFIIALIFIVGIIILILEIYSRNFRSEARGK